MTSDYALDKSCCLDLKATISCNVNSRLSTTTSKATRNSPLVIEFKYNNALIDVLMFVSCCNSSSALSELIELGYTGALPAGKPPKPPKPPKGHVKIPPAPKVPQGRMDMPGAPSEAPSGHTKEMTPQEFCLESK
ncbi:Hypothetical protein CINCED_3A005497 [Cinara cedri]|uniref:Uncharacterized protein n=1 Tax=Cinara cedri TaxID=506608 RepID=A0A5E4NPE3_9HEMI|nr:Hypothetical protein CINCED_3A005497 [Cinara cedri]